MNFTFENQGTNTYLVYAVNSEDSIDTMSLGMLTNNNILGLAPTQYTQMDTMKYIKYNISAHVSVKQFFAGPVNKKRLIGVFKGIVDAMLSAEEYMIDVSTIVMDMDYMFADVSTCETVVVCLPILNYEQNNVDLGAFFKNIIFTTQFDQTENCDHVAKLMNYLNSSPMFSLTEFKSVLDEIDRGVATVNNVQQVQEPVAVVKPAPPAQQPVVPKEVKANNVIPTPANTSVINTPPTSQGAKEPVKQKPLNIPPASQNFGGMQIPGPSNANVVEKKTTNEADNGEKISMFYLLQHYNKENAAAYKAQKEAKKNQKSSTNSKPAKEKSSKNKVGAPPPPIGFAVPGAPAQAPNNNFAIPGQVAPAPMKTNFATPAQPVIQQNASVAPQPTATVQQETSVIASPAYPANTVPQGHTMNFGETTVLGGGAIGETTVLGAAPSAVQPKPHLIRARNNEKINLDKPVFRIGKEKSYVDYFIGDNTAISRSHANFVSRDNKYYVMDTNSTNHTYVNGAMIQSNVETQLTHGDKVCLANEDFEFKLY